MSFYIAIGRFSPLYFKFHKRSIRLCLGFIAFSLLFYDLEVEYNDTIEKAIAEIKSLQGKKDG